MVYLHFWWLLAGRPAAGRPVSGRPVSGRVTIITVIIDARAGAGEVIFVTFSRHLIRQGGPHRFELF
jgi:hypothetical protein